MITQPTIPYTDNLSSIKTYEKNAVSTGQLHWSSAVVFAEITPNAEF